ncbi:uncharacterized protein TNCV_3896191 [Trichonephila clavipes]|nr:uncharacterized protein TNCV_3896191 [Trichonephila clavipes]
MRFAKSRLRTQSDALSNGISDPTRPRGFLYDSTPDSMKASLESVHPIVLISIPGGPRNMTSSVKLTQQLEISFEPPRRIRRKHIFGDGSKDVQLSYEDDLRRTMFYFIDGATAEIRERFRQLQNLAQKHAFFKALK